MISGIYSRYSLNCSIVCATKPIINLHIAGLCTIMKNTLNIARRGNHSWGRQICYQTVSSLIIIAGKCWRKKSFFRMKVLWTFLWSKFLEIKHENYSVGRYLAKELGVPYFECSVLTFFGVEEIFINAARAALCTRSNKILKIIISIIEW